MPYFISPYTWDRESPNPVPGVKINSNDDGINRFLFIPEAELFNVANQIADYIDARQNAGT